ncbi:MAG TPA: type IV toxin-antitoxin system AbiEi family antitoxin domain-containing protein [Solirubrobacterales bacterium]|nr:type IV toxin-antitoxin system AbiEi family antitoxin domain-containing protein [Solirubrobacterales bacterium]
MAEFAERQYGVVSIRQLERRLGYSRKAVQREVASGHLHPLYRGVYAVGHRVIPPHGHCLAAVLASGPNTLLSHGSAAWLWGVSRYGAAPLHVTSPVPRKPRPPIRLHHSRILTEADRAIEENIPVTALPRTLLDCAAEYRLLRLQRMLERSEELKLFDLGPVEELLQRSGRHAGRGPLRQAIALYAPVPFTRSGFERRFFEAVLGAGLPRPATNFVEAGFELDLYWAEHRFAVELDTYATHGTHAAFERDHLRDEDLTLAGIELIRVTDVRFHREPEAVLKRVATLLARRSGN